MFNFLKEKIKNWAAKIKEEFKEKQELKEAQKKEDKKTKKQKEKKKTKKKKETIEEKNIPLVVEETKKTKEKEFEEEILEETKEEIKKKKEGFFSRFFKKELTEEKFNELFQELEMILLQNNVAFEVVEKIKEELSKRVVGKKDYDIEEELKNILKEILIESPDFIEEIKKSLKNKKPYVILFFGINGSGKTTTIAKLANLLKKKNFSVCLAAADTYRAASIEQLETHAKNLQIPLIKKDYGSDPASVGFEAIQYAKKHLIDIVLIDSAGRLNNKESLMKELEKIARVTNPDLKIFVGESITGNDATEQAKSFNEKIGIDGTILTKADVDEKGGTMISIGFVTKKPIYFLGVGQNYDDLEVFDKEKIIKSLS